MTDDKDKEYWIQEAWDDTLRNILPEFKRRGNLVLRERIKYLKNKISDIEKQLEKLAKENDQLKKDNLILDIANKILLEKFADEFKD